MDYPNNITDSRKNKHLNYEERMFIQLRLQDGFTPYKIAKQLGRALNTILNEIRKGTTTQIIAKKKVDVYLASTGKAVYDNNRKNSCKLFKRLECSAFIDYATKMIKEGKWSPDTCVGRALKSGKFKRSEMVCTKTLYNYIDLGLMSVKNSDLPLKLQYNTKSKRTRKNKRKLGNSIELRPKSVDLRKEFGHWEIDTVIGKKSKGEEVLLTIVERQTRNAIIRRISSKSADAVSNEFKKIQSFFGDRFSKVFKTITSDNGSEFSELHELESISFTKVYFTHPYSSFERGTNERHNGLIRRFIPKGKSINDYADEDISFIEEWMNSLPRKILGYNTPEELFEDELDAIYAS